MPAYYLEALTVFLGLVLLMFEAFGPSHHKRQVGICAAFGLAFIFVLSFFAIGPDDVAENADKAWTKWALWEFYTYDALARFYKGFAIVATILMILMALDYRPILARFTDHPESESGTGEYFALPVFACAGMMWMASAKDLIFAFVALELVTITFYILVTFLRRNVGSLEAGVKYLILGALSTGFLVYGIAWIYGATGTMNLVEMRDKLGAIENTTPLLFGVALVLIALGFKIGAAPTHIWIPDVYQGAATPTTAFLAVGSKAAGFILLIRFLEPMMGHEAIAKPVLFMLLLMAIATLLVGNLGAIAQSNLKRLLAYSSIAHAGFLLLALAAWKPDLDNEMGSIDAVSFYLATYLIMTMAVFFLLAQMRLQHDSEEIAAFDGLGRRDPVIAIVLTTLMAGLAGVPLTAGFWGKFFVFSLAVEANHWIAVGVASVAAAAGFYYYFKLVRAMWWNASPDGAGTLPMPQITRVAVLTMTVAVLVLGIWPQPILWLLG